MTIENGIAKALKSGKFLSLHHYAWPPSCHIDRVTAVMSKPEAESRW